LNGKLNLKSIEREIINSKFAQMMVQDYQSMTPKLLITGVFTEEDARRLPKPFILDGVI